MKEAGQVFQSEGTLCLRAQRERTAGLRRHYYEEEGQLEMKLERSVEGQNRKGLSWQVKEVKLRPKDDWKLLKGGDRMRSVFYFSETIVTAAREKSKAGSTEGMVVSPKTSENGQLPT